ncbi:MAG: M15 family metallopeptidase [Clostridia bacterium]|nr:M15 family metallopeptidase [Clostridia bacterium]
MVEKDYEFYCGYDFGEESGHTHQYGGASQSSTRKSRRHRRKRRRLSLFLMTILIISALMASVAAVFGNVLSEHLLALLVNLQSDPLRQENDRGTLKNENAQNREDAEEPFLILVNRDNPLPAGYETETVTLRNNEKVDERIYPSLQKMFDDMRAEGIYPVVASGYRTKEEQQIIMDEKIQAYRAEGYCEEDAANKAREWVALPGTSEHETGLAVDINADTNMSSGEEVYEWLRIHAHEYGFIKRYPQDKSEITGICDEPWHYRYVGESAAAEITEQNLCLEEYLKRKRSAPKNSVESDGFLLKKPRIIYFLEEVFLK